MQVVINDIGEIVALAKGENLKVELRDGERQIRVIDKDIKEAFYRGEEIHYNKFTDIFYFIPTEKIDPEKVALFEAVASLFEEVEELKSKLGGGK